jgi:hypothetical protein
MKINLTPLVKRKSEEENLRIPTVKLFFNTQLQNIFKESLQGAISALDILWRRLLIAFLIMNDSSMKPGT